MDTFVGALIVLIVLIVIFIIIRAFWLWYWKINEGISLLKSIRDDVHALRRASQVATPPALEQTIYEPPSIPVAQPSPEAGTRIRVARQSVLRAEPQPNASLAGRVEVGTWLNVVTAQPRWIWVQTDDGLEGWLQLPVAT